MPTARFHAAPATIWSSAATSFRARTSFDQCVVLRTLALEAGSSTSPPTSKSPVCEADSATWTRTVNGVPSSEKTKSVSLFVVPDTCPSLCRLTPVTSRRIENGASPSNANCVSSASSVSETENPAPSNAFTASASSFAIEASVSPALTM